MGNSFAQQVKIDLCALPLKKKCCRRSFLYGAMCASHSFSRERIELRADAAEISAQLCALISGVFGVECEACAKIAIFLPGELDLIFDGLSEADTEPDRALFGCEHCCGTFLRGAFIECGTVNAPDKSRHLEFCVPDKRRSQNIAGLFTEFGIEPRLRPDLSGIYFKGSESVEDVLNLIGAQKAAFELMNSKIRRELMNNANRSVNCDTANITKTIDASRQQVAAIERILLRKDIPEELIRTAQLRREYPDASLASLAELHDPPITKSGVKHRLDRIMKYI